MAPAVRSLQGEVDTRYRGVQWLDLEHDCHRNDRERQALRRLA
jgi:hypothetical protein